jgi:hypothetical protein
LWEDVSGNRNTYHHTLLLRTDSHNIFYGTTTDHYMVILTLSAVAQINATISISIALITPTIHERFLSPTFEQVGATQPFGRALSRSICRIDSKSESAQLD